MVRFKYDTRGYHRTVRLEFHFEVILSSKEYRKYKDRVNSEKLFFQHRNKVSFSLLLPMFTILVRKIMISQNFVVLLENIIVKM